MPEFLRELSVPVLTATAVAFTALYLAFFYRYVLRSRTTGEERFRQTVQRFQRELDNRIGIDGISSMDDINEVKQFISNETGDARFAATPIQAILQYYLSDIANSTEGEAADGIRGKYFFISGLINSSRSIGQFAYLPPRDSATAMQLQDAISAGEAESAERYLQVLSESLGAQIRQANSRSRIRLGATILGVVFSMSGLIAALISLLLLN